MSGALQALFPPRALLLATYGIDRAFTAGMQNGWPELPFHAWRDTHATLHMWLQIVGKTRLAQTPWINHSWHVTLYVTARGLSTLAIPHGGRAFHIEFDFLDHKLRIDTTEGRSRTVPLEPQPVALFYRQVMDALGELQVPVAIPRKPNEVADPIAFHLDETHRAYDAEYAQRFWRALVQAGRVLNKFRARFRGKSSPVHFFWGNTDLSVSRFSGRIAPLHPGGRSSLPDRVLQEAYSHEVTEFGFWTGGADHPEPLFYAMAYPEPPGFAEARVSPAAAHYSQELKEFILPYDAVRRSGAPDETLLEFLQSTYEAVATRAQWDRKVLEFHRP